jgi:hypothetical protein
MHLVLRLPARFGGDDNLYRGIFANFDTGSDIQSIYQADLTAVRYNPNTYSGRRGWTNIVTANGTVSRFFVQLELCIMDPATGPNFRSFTPWIEVMVAIIPDTMDRLTGREMFQHAWFGLSPTTTDVLYAGRSKHALNARFP